MYRTTKYPRSSPAGAPSTQARRAAAMRRRAERAPIVRATASRRRGGAASTCPSDSESAPRRRRIDLSERQRVGAEEAPHRHGGAGGNRTPVHQAVTARATTIPECGAHAAPPPGRLTSPGGPRIVFPIGQRSFPPPACFQAVILRFCCRAAVDRPRAALRLTMTVYLPGIRRRQRTAGWQLLLVPRLASLSNSGRTLGQRN